MTLLIENTFGNFNKFLPPFSETKSVDLTINFFVIQLGSHLEFSSLCSWLCLKFFDWNESCEKLILGSISFKFSKTIWYENKALKRYRESMKFENFINLYLAQIPTVTAAWSKVNAAWNSYILDWICAFTQGSLSSANSWKKHGVNIVLQSDWSLHSTRGTFPRTLVRHEIATT